MIAFCLFNNFCHYNNVRNRIKVKQLLGLEGCNSFVKYFPILFDLRHEFLKVGTGVKTALGRKIYSAIHISPIMCIVISVIQYRSSGRYGMSEKKKNGKQALFS